MKVLFLHGYQSSANTNKYTVIDEKHEKYCESVDYDALSFDETFEFYVKLVEKFDPDVIVGHSLGGYWALKMGEHFGLNIVTLNPQLFPRFDGYDHYNTIPLGFPLVSYVEEGDEVLDVSKTVEVLSRRGILITHAGGHHRLENPGKVNNILNMIDKNSTNYI